ncbi:hypothetical protein BGZ70_001590 [Mortierella alpina]|uniref:GDP-fucose protein O-fucosyltransferase 2 n=1 Tax=Mortierella alpina TaxID=64518 RepID=A0A9P6JC47_MORAP|nr:hypothetical protein BGZ70_001590 [Mortierella alpina]
MTFTTSTLGAATTRNYLLLDLTSHEQFSTPVNLPYAGLTNQFIGIQHAAWLALHLNRTLILPPITSNKHDHQFTFQKWSTYFDIPRFEQLTGLQVKEWPDLKHLTEAEMAVGIERARQSHPKPPLLAEWNSLAENITCQVTKDFNTLEGVARIFAHLFLLRVSFVDPPPPSPLSHPTPMPESMVSLCDIRERYQNSPERSLYFSHTFGLKGSSLIRPFDDIGRHIYFRPEIVDRARQMVQAFAETAQPSPTSPPPSPSSSSFSSSSSPASSASSASSAAAPAAPAAAPSPSKNTAPRPYIAIHLRRDDIINKCIDRKTHTVHTPIQHCMPSMDQYAAMVAKARQRLQLRTSLEPLVIVMTDTTSEQDLKAIDAYGWHRMDHDQQPDSPTRQLGVFGPAMVDAAILAYADELIGTQVSTMSAIAQARRRSWFGQDTLYP